MVRIIIKYKRKCYSSQIQNISPTKHSQIKFSTHWASNLFGAAVGRGGHLFHPSLTEILDLLDSKLELHKLCTDSKFFGNFETWPEYTIITVDLSGKYHIQYIFLSLLTLSIRHQHLNHSHMPRTFKALFSTFPFSLSKKCLSAI